MASEQSAPARPAPEHLPLRADCSRCFALCCVAPAFAASADFAITKPAGTPCPHLRPDFRCGTHHDLRERGMRGCTVYDCFGAGQQVSQVTFAGRDWQRAPGTARRMFAVFPIVRDLHELLWYLTEALTLTGASAAPGASPLHDELRLARDETERLARGDGDALLALDVTTHRRDVNALLLRASELARATERRASDGGASDRRVNDGRAARGRAKGRAGAGERAVDRRGADLLGARLAGADLRRANLRATRLIGADLRRADLSRADLTGADLRDADLRGADLSDSLFLLQSQLDAAKGDATTRLPPSLTRPRHW